MRRAVGSISAIGIVLVGILTTGITAQGADGEATQDSPAEASITTEAVMVPSSAPWMEEETVVEVEGETEGESAPTAPASGPEPATTPEPAPAPEAEAAPEPVLEIPSPAPPASGATPMAASDPAPGFDAVPFAIGGLTFAPSRPAPGGSITVTGSGCAPGEPVLIRTWMTTMGSFTFRDGVVWAITDGSFTAVTHVYGAPGSDPMPSAGAQFGVAAHCGGVATTDPELSQIVYGLIAGVNTAPMAISDTYPVAHETSLSIGAPGVLSNDNDTDGDMITAHLFTDPASGTLTNFMPDGSFTYAPDAGFSGTDSFVYYAWDGVAASADVTVTLTVAAAPTRPVAVDDSFTTGYETPLHVPLAEGLLANDSDADGDSIRVCLATSTHPVHGTLTYPSNDGRFSYTPDAGFTGTVTFTYHAGDSIGCGDFATVTITVSAPREPMSAADDASVALSGVPLRLDVLINDLGTGIEVTSMTSPSAGTAVISADGLSIIYTSVVGFVGMDTFRYTITDDAGDMDIAEVEVGVLPPCAFGLCEPVDPVDSIDSVDSGETLPVEVRAPGGTSPAAGTTTSGLAETGGSIATTGFALLSLMLVLLGVAATRRGARRSPRSDRRAS